MSVYLFSFLQKLFFQRLLIFEEKLMCYNTKKICDKNTYKAYRYEYSSSDKSSIYKIEGTRKKSFRLPPLSEKPLQITYRYLVIQIKTPYDSNPTITISISNDAGNHFNFAFSTVSKKRPSSSQMCALINLPLVKDVWVNVCFDLQKIAAIYWPGGSYQLLDSIEISPTCSIRNVYASNEPLDELADGSDLPKPYEHAFNIESKTLLLPIEEDDQIEETLATSQSKPSLKPVPADKNKRSPKKSSKPPFSAKSQPSNAIQIEGTQLRSSQTNVKFKNLQAKKPKINAKTEPIKTVIEDITVSNESSDSIVFVSNDFETASDSVHTSESAENKASSLATEEEELELIYIENLGCYYCPSNNNYYQLNN